MEVGSRELGRVDSVDGVGVRSRGGRETRVRTQQAAVSVGADSDALVPCRLRRFSLAQFFHCLLVGVWNGEGGCGYELGVASFTACTLLLRQFYVASGERQVIGGLPYRRSSRTRSRGRRRRCGCGACSARTWARSLADTVP